MPGPPLLDETALEAALLTVADMPPGWKGSGESSGTRSQAKAGSWADWFCASAVSAVGADTTPVTGASFDSPPLFFPSLSQWLISVPDADEMWLSTRQAFDSCLGQTWRGDVLSIPDIDDRVPAPAVGDEAIAYRVADNPPGNSPPGSYPSYTNVVLARRGSVIEFYVGHEFGDYGEMTFPPGQFDEIVTTGDSKVAATLAVTGKPGQ